MRAYRYLDEIAIADAAFEARGDTPAELFRAAAEALTALMADPARLVPRSERRIMLRHSDLDGLLYDWLSELVTLKDAERLLFSHFDLNVVLEPEARLEAIVTGEPIDPARHALRGDVKAITLHQFNLEHADAGWRARVVVDL